MNASGLYDSFRSDVVDTAKPYLWSDEEVFSYMDAAYRQFVRRTVGIADFTSDVTKIDVVIGEALAPIDPSILRVMSATKESDGREIVVANMTDATFMRSGDYSAVRQLAMDKQPGPVRYMIIGAERGKVKWVQIPVTDDIINLHVYRLPLVRIVDDTHPLDEVDEDHHIYLLDWMKHLAYKKQDAETFDRSKSKEHEEAFLGYCAQCVREWERYKHKTRVVAYGGI